MQPHRRQPTRPRRPWDSPGKNTGVSCHFLLQCMKVKLKSLSCVRLFATPWTAAYQAPLSMGFSRQEYWSGVPLPSLAKKPETDVNADNTDKLIPRTDPTPGGFQLLSSQTCFRYSQGNSLNTGSQIRKGSFLFLPFFVELRSLCRGLGEAKFCFMKKKRGPIISTSLSQPNPQPASPSAGRGKSVYSRFLWHGSPGN